MPFKNEVSEKADEIVRDIRAKVQEEGSAILEYEFDRPQALRQAVRARVNEMGFRQRVNLAVTDVSLVVRIKEITYTTKLEKMVRRLALHVDDENLYDEALSLVGVI